MSTDAMPEALGRYKIVRELGKGAMGLVYEGIDPNINRRVAIKTARRDVMSASGRADEMMERFLREAKACGKLNHPNVITIYDADVQEGLAYIAMEFLEGGDLEGYIRQKQRFTPEEAVEIGATVAEALHHAHSQGIIHRDVKPANVFRLPDGTLKVGDFGIARTEDSSLTQEGAMIGTPHYMSPEQFMGQRADGRSDLFSVAIMIYELLTGEKPFGGEALTTVMHNVLKVDPIPPSELNFAVNETLDAVVMKALSKPLGKRYQDGKLLAAALRESLKENPNPAVTLLGGGLQATVAGDPPPCAVTQPGAGDTVLADQLPPGISEDLSKGAASGAAATKLARTATSAEPNALQNAEDHDETLLVSHQAGADPKLDSGSLDATGESLRTGESRDTPTKSKVTLFIGVAVVALIAVGVTIMMMSGGSDTGSSSVPGVTVAATKYFSSANIVVFLAPDKAAYDEAQRGNLQNCEIDEPVDVYVEQKDAAGTWNVVKSFMGYNKDTIEFNGLDSGRIRVEKEGYGNSVKEFPKPGRANDIFAPGNIILLKEVDF